MMIYMEQERVFVGIIHGLVTVGLICYICKQTMCIFLYLWTMCLY